ncbi:MAG TPA: aminotransferase class I/II-fold pyridoxal phosphate-dependent enzyme [Nitriliruptorales bacterium]
MTTLAIEGGTPVRTTALDHRRGVTRIGPEERDALVEVIGSRSLFRYYGPDLREKVAGFEAGVRARLDVPHATATSSGTAALLAALAAVGVGPGDEVVVPAVTFIATVNAVVESGAVPIFCDVDASLSLDASALSASITPRTAAVVPVHLENVVADLDGVLAAAVGLPVIEDACQAMGATYHGREAGTIGTMGAFSLQLEKNITSGEGGVLVTSDEELHWRALRYTDQGGQFTTSHGSARGGERDEAFVGTNLRMNELTGAVAGVQLGRLDAVLAAMRANKAKILDAIGTRPGMQPRAAADPAGDGGSSITWYLPDAQVTGRFVAALSAEGIPCVTMYDGLPVYATPSIMQQRTITPKRSPWARHPVPVSYRTGMCPRAEDLLARSVTVGVGASYTAADLDDVAEAVGKVADAVLGVAG